MRMLIFAARLAGRRQTAIWKRKDSKTYMLRAMTSAVSGLRGHQQKLDVIGNNIANVNTVGYKSQSYTFKDTMYQSATGSTNGTDKAGGVNAAQYGYGSVMGTISMDMTGSSATYVSGFAASIDGQGFFITKASKDDKVTLQQANNAATAATNSTELKNANFEYTRVGKFIVDSQGYIVDGNGNFVYGYRTTNTDGTTNTTPLEALRIPKEVAAGGNITISDAYGDGEALEAESVKLNKAGDIEAVLTVNGKTQTVKIGTLGIATFQNQDGLTKNGNSYYTSSLSDNTGVCSAGKPGDGRGTLMPGYLETSNVDMAVEFSEMIMAERGFQANSKIITVSDEILSDLISMKR